MNYILEFARYFSHSEESRNLGVELYIQIELDATSSVLQINSVLSTNTDLAQLVNLLPGKASSNKELSSKKKPATDRDLIKIMEKLIVLDVYSSIKQVYKNRMLTGGKDILLSSLKQQMQTNNLKLSDTLDNFISWLDRPVVKPHIMTKMYNKGLEQLAQDIYEHISLMEAKQGTSLVIEEENYQDISIDVQSILDISYNPIDFLIQNKEKKFFITDDLDLRSKIRSVKTLLPMPIFDEKDPQQNKEEFIEDSFPLEEVDHVNDQTSELALLFLNNGVNIESNFFWVHYFFQRFFFEFRKQKDNSLKAFKDKLMSLQNSFEEVKYYDNFLSVDSKKIVSKVETIPTKITFNTYSPEKALRRRQILIEIKEILIKNYQSLQKREFTLLLSRLITDILHEICDERLRDVFINSEFVSLLAYFVSNRKCCFTVNCFEHASYRTYYTLLESTTFYFADALPKKKDDKIKKKRVKVGFFGSTPDSSKSSIAASANFVQACDAEILRHVVFAFLSRFFGKGLFVRHDAFVVDPSTVFEIQNLYKESLLKVFFKKDAVSKGAKTNKVFLRVFNNKENLIKETGLDTTESPLFIFQTLILSNIFNLLDLSENKYIEEFKVKNKKILKRKNRKVKILLLEFLYEPSSKSLYLFLQNLKGTILDFNLDEEQKEIVPEETEIDPEVLKQSFKDQLEQGLQKKIDKGNNLIQKWVKQLENTTEGVKRSIAVEQKKVQPNKGLEKKITKKKTEIELLEKDKSKISEKTFTPNPIELLKFKEKLELKETKKLEQECRKFNKEYEKVKQSIAIKKSYTTPTLRHILIRYSIIHARVKSNKFNWNDLLLFTRALS